MYGMPYIVNQMSSIRQAIAEGATIVALVDEPGELEYIQGIVTLGILLPPYESLSAELDGNKEMAASIYMEYLSSKERMDAITAVLAALHAGKSIVFYVPEEESMNFGFVRTFMYFMAANLGVFIGDGIGLGEPFSPRPGYDTNYSKEALRLELLLINGFLPFDQFCVEYPPTIVPTDMTCSFIMQFTNYKFANMDQCKDYCVQQINAVKTQMTTNKKVPLFRVK